MLNPHPAPMFIGAPLSIYDGEGNEFSGVLRSFQRRRTKEKKGVRWNLVALLLLVAFLAAGCGQGGTVVAVDLSNQGTIQGRVYDYSASNFSAGVLIPIASAKVYLGTVETSTAADGSYSFSGISAGEVVITASAEGYVTQSIFANRKTINLYLTGGRITSEAGSAAIHGTIYGLPAGISSVEGTAASLRKNSSGFTYNSALYEYALAGAPDDGETYLFASYATNEASPRSIYTYKKVEMASASKEASLDFGASTASLIIKSALPANYSNLQLSVDVYNGYRLIKNIYTGVFAENISRLPALQAGDSFGVSLSAVSSNTTEAGLWLSQNNISAGSTVNFDFTGLSTAALASPADGAALSAYPTFSWEAVSDERTVYMVDLYRGNTKIWTAMTKANSIAYPPAAALADGSCRWQVNALKYTNLDLADIGATLPQSYRAWSVTAAQRSLTYAK